MGKAGVKHHPPVGYILTTSRVPSGSCPSGGTSSAQVQLFAQVPLGTAVVLVPALPVTTMGTAGYIPTPTPWNRCPGPVYPGGFPGPSSLTLRVTSPWAHMPGVLRTQGGTVRVRLSTARGALGGGWLLTLHAATPTPLRACSGPVNDPSFCCLNLYSRKERL